MTCALCSAEVETVTHHFAVGDPRRPAERWSITAPLYFKATADFRSVVEGYCGSACSTAGHGNIDAVK